MTLENPFNLPPDDDNGGDSVMDGTHAVVHDMIQQEMQAFVSQQLLPLLKEHSESIMARIPSLEALTQEVTRRLQSGAAQVKANGQISPPAPDASPSLNDRATPPKPTSPEPAEVREIREQLAKTRITDVVDPPANNSSVQPPPVAGGVNLAQIMVAVAAMLDKGFDKWMLWQELQLKKTNVFAFAANLAATSPYEARFLGAMLNPDPMGKLVPGILAQNTLNTTNAVIRAMAPLLRENGWSPPQGADFDPFVPSGGPSSNPSGGIGSPPNVPLAPPTSPSTPTHIPDKTAIMSNDSQRDSANFWLDIARRDGP